MMIKKFTLMAPCVFWPEVLTSSQTTVASLHSRLLQSPRWLVQGTAPLFIVSISVGVSSKHTTIMYDQDR